MKRIRAYAPRIIAAQADEQTDWVPPESLEWMPAGTHSVNCMTGSYVVTTSEVDAENLNNKLQNQLALAKEGKASRPFIDFNHEAKDAAAIPVKFFWQDGIRLAVEWTQAGLDALKGRVFSYFSPEFYLGDDGHPVSLPEVGPIGGLVNTPAFQTIERLAASAAVNKPPEGDPSTTIKETMEKFIARLAAAGVIPQSASVANEDQLFDLFKSLNDKTYDMTEKCSALTERATKAEAKVAEAETELGTIKAAQKKELETRATLDVTEAIKCGKIEESSKDSWVALYVANPDTVRASLSAINVAKAQQGHPNDKLPGNKGSLEDKMNQPLNRVQAAFKKQIEAYKGVRN